MIPHTNPLINRMYISQPLLILTIIPRRKPKNMPRQIPEEARVCIPRHDARSGDDVRAVDGAVRAGKDGIGSDFVGV